MYAQSDLDLRWVHILLSCFFLEVTHNNYCYHANVISMRRGICPCADPERFDIGDPTLTIFFLVDVGREYLNTTKAGHHRPSSFRWHAYDGPALNGSFVIFQGKLTSIAKNPTILRFSRGLQAPYPPLWIRPCCP